MIYLQDKKVIELEFLIKIENNQKQIHMLQTIGAFIDVVIPIGGGVFLLTQLKRINKPYIKWIAIVMILMGILLIILDIIDIKK